MFDGLASILPSMVLLVVSLFASLFTCEHEVAEEDLLVC